jgi:hypothetical protein
LALTLNFKGGRQKMRKTIYLANATETYLKYHSDHTGIPKATHSLSKVVNIVIDRYSEIIKENMLNLEINEWNLVVNSLKGVWTIEPATNTLTMIVGKIEEGLNDPKVTGKYGVDPEALRKKLQGLSMAQKLVMVDVAEIFWLSLKRNDPELDDKVGINQALAISQKKEI